MPHREPTSRKSDSTPEYYLEDLVSIAISSARRADDASRNAHASMTKARHGVYTIAVLSMLGITVALVELEGKSILTAAGITSAVVEGDQATSARPTAAPILFARLVPTESVKICVTTPRGGHLLPLNHRLPSERDFIWPSGPSG
jgi:hypothetical protein